jgi:putative ABC transport system permease protein
MKNTSFSAINAIITTIIRRLFAQPFLLFVIWLGFTVAIALTVSIPVYAEAAGYRMLISAISAKTDQGNNLPPFSLIFKYGSASTKPISYDQWLQADYLMANLRGYGVDLPPPPTVRYGASEKLEIRFPDSKPITPSITRARIGFLTDFENHIRLTYGRMPAVWDGTGPMEVLVADSLATKSTILIDDQFLAHKRGGRYGLDVTVKIVGLWQARNDNDLYWFTPAAAYSDVFFVPETTWKNLVHRPPAEFVEQAGWYAAYDGTGVQSNKTAALSTAITTINSEMGQLLPGIDLYKSPLDQLARQRDEVQKLTVTLLLFGVPLIGLLLAFVWQITGLLVARQELEIAVLRSRGVTRAQLLGMSLCEGVFVATSALVAGVPLSLLFARAIALTQSFLRFDSLNVPTPQLTPQSWGHGAIIASFAIPALLLPAISLTKNTIVTLRQSQARNNRPSWVSRLYIDVLLLIPAWYGYQQLALGKSLAVPGVNDTQALNNPFQNPLLLLAPALFIGATSLLLIRIFPALIRIIANLIQNIPGVALISSLRQLSRNPGTLRGPTLLLILTISLATFTASMARTLDQYSIDRANYRSGADFRMLPRTLTVTSADIAGDVPNLPNPDLLQGGGTLTSTGGEQSASISLDYLYVPLDDFKTVDSITAVTNVAANNVDFIVNGSDSKGILYSINPSSFTSVVAATWRNDYADQSLGAIINLMSTSMDQAIVSTKFATDNNLRIGDRFTVIADFLGTRTEVSLSVAAIITYMPTLYNEGPAFVIANYAYISDELNGLYPYEIWLHSDGHPDAPAVQAAAYRNSLQVMPYTPQAFINADILQPQRQGLFGLLSVGFLATGGMSLIGLMAYTLLALRKRSVELGVLRAIGISQQSLRGILTIEQLITIGFSTLSGIAVGVITSNMYLPFLKVQEGTYPNTPPFLVQFAQTDTALIALTAVILMVGIVLLELWIVQRMRIGEAVKLGEAV